MVSEERGRYRIREITEAGVANWFLPPAGQVSESGSYRIARSY